MYTFDDLINSYPLGAGLGRWGMIAGYFGGGPERTLWAEIQVAGWAIDGGIPLVLVSVAVLVVVLLAERRLALTDPDAKVRACAAVVLAANLGTAALIFSFTPFVTQIGLQFWFLAGAVQAIATRTDDVDAHAGCSSRGTSRPMAGWTWRISRSRGIWRGAGTVHLVAHRVSPELAALPHVRVHAVPRPFGVHRFGEPILRSTARRVQRSLAADGVRTVANGGNADLGDLNWVHYVHAAFEPVAAGLRTGCSSHGNTGDTSPKSARRSRARGWSSATASELLTMSCGWLAWRGTGPGSFTTESIRRRFAGRRRGARAPRAVRWACRAPAGWRSLSARSAIGAKGSTRCSARGRRSAAARSWDVDLLVAGTGAELERGRPVPRASCLRAGCASWVSGATCRPCSRPATC